MEKVEPGGVQAEVFRHQDIVDLVPLSILLKQAVDVVSGDVLHPYQLTALFKLFSGYKIRLVRVLSVQSLENCFPFIRHLGSHLLSNSRSWKQRKSGTTLGVSSAPKGTRGLDALVHGLRLAVGVLSYHCVQLVLALRLQ